MPLPTLTRRALLLGTAGAVFATACSSKGKDDITTEPNDFSGSKGVPGQFNLVVPSSLLLAGVDQRVALAMTTNDRSFIRPTGPISLAFASIEPDVPEPAFGPAVPGVVHTDAGDAPAYITVNHTFPKAGNYWVQASHEGQVAKAAVAIRDRTDPTIALIPAPGDPMIRTPTPTVADHRGVEPICTREPACPWHDVSLDAALDEKRPLVVLFSTPKLCQTAVCGPVLETLLSLRETYEAKVRFVHLEVFADGSGKAANPPAAPAVQAYHLEGEPFVFFAGADGKVVHRIDGLFGRAEAEEGLNRISA